METNPSLEERIVQLTKRVELLERQLQETTSSAITSSSIPKESTPAVSQPSLYYEEKKNEQRTVPQKFDRTELTQPATDVNALVEKSTIQWEEQLGKVWLPRLFAFILLLGVLWLFKAGIDAGWFTPIMQVIVGFIVSGALFVYGDKTVQKGRSALGIALVVVSIFTFLFTVWVGHQFYTIFNVPVAFTLALLCIAWGTYKAFTYQSVAYLSLLMIFGILVPMLLESNEPNIIFFTVYEMLWLVALFFVASKLSFRTFLFLQWISYFLIITLAFITSVDSYVTLVILAYTLPILLYVYEMVRHSSVRTKDQLLLTAAALTVSLLPLSFLIENTKWLWNLDAWDMYLFVVAVLAFTLGFRIRTSFVMGRETAWSISFFFLALWLFNVLSTTVLPVAFVLQAVLAYRLGVLFNSEFKKIESFVLTWLSFVLHFKLFIGFALPTLNEWSTHADVFEWSSFLTITIQTAAVVAITLMAPKQERVYMYYASIFATLAYFTLVIDAMIEPIITKPSATFENMTVPTSYAVFGYAATSLVWVAYYYVLRFWKKDIVHLFVPYAFLAVALFKLVLVDSTLVLGSVNDFVLDGAVAFVSVGITSWYTWIFALLLTTFIGVLYKLECSHSGAPSITISLGSLCLFVLFFFTTHGTLFIFDDASYSTQQLALSTIWIIESFLFLFIGRLQNNRIIQRIGFALLFLTLGKIFIVDLSEFTFVVRGALFVFIGIIGFIVSRFYYKNSQ